MNTSLRSIVNEKIDLGILLGWPHGGKGSKLPSGHPGHGQNYQISKNYHMKMEKNIKIYQEKMDTIALQVKPLDMDECLKDLGVDGKPSIFLREAIIKHPVVALNKYTVYDEVTDEIKSIMLESKQVTTLYYNEKNKYVNVDIDDKDSAQIYSSIENQNTDSMIGLEENGKYLMSASTNLDVVSTGVTGHDHQGFMDYNLCLKFPSEDSFNNFINKTKMDADSRPIHKVLSDHKAMKTFEEEWNNTLPAKYKGLVLDPVNKEVMGINVEENVLGKVMVEEIDELTEPIVKFDMSKLFEEEVK